MMKYPKQYKSFGILGHFWDNSGTNLGLFWDNLIDEKVDFGRTNLGQSWDNSGTKLGLRKGWHGRIRARQKLMVFPVGQCLGQIIFAGFCWFGFRFLIGFSGVFGWRGSWLFGWNLGWNLAKNRGWFGAWKWLVLGSLGMGSQSGLNGWLSIWNGGVCLGGIILPNIQSESLSYVS